jgi:hypothetical protein
VNEQHELDDLAAKLRAVGLRGTPLDILERGNPDEIGTMQQVVAPLLGRYRSHDAFAQTHLAVFADRWPAESAVVFAFRALLRRSVSQRHKEAIAGSLHRYVVDETYFVVVKALLVGADTGERLRFHLVSLLRHFAATEHAREAADLVVEAMSRNPYSILDVGSSTLLRLRAFDRRAEVRQILETSEVHPEVRRAVERRLDSMERAAAKTAQDRNGARLAVAPKRPVTGPAAPKRAGSASSTKLRTTKSTTPNAAPTRPARGSKAPTEKKSTVKKPARANTKGTISPRPPPRSPARTPDR